MVPLANSCSIPTETTVDVAVGEVEVAGPTGHFCICV